MAARSALSRRRALLIFLALAGSACAARPGPPSGGITPSVAPAASPAAAPTTSVGVSPTPGEARCRSADLHLALGDRISEPTGQHTLVLTLTNESSASCTLFGYPKVALLDNNGQALPFDYRQSGDQVVTSNPPSRVVLPSGNAAYVTINKYRCDLGDKAAASAVQLIPPDDAMSLQVGISQAAISLGYCGPGDPGSSVAVSPVEATLRETLAH